MGELARIRQDSYESYGEDTLRPPRSNRRGELVVCDFWTQLVFDGRMFHMQMGTESTPVNSETTVDDQRAWMVVDGTDGWTLLPAIYEVGLAVLAAATVIEAYLEIDRAKIRYSSTGTAYVPENLRTDRPRTSIASAAYVGPDVTVAAKTAVPGSIEIGRHNFIEDAIATATGAETKFYCLNARERPLPAVVGIGSICCHFGASTADCTGYGCVEWAELPSESVR